MFDSPIWRTMSVHQAFSGHFILAFVKQNIYIEITDREGSRNSPFFSHKNKDKNRKYSYSYSFILSFGFFFLTVMACAQ